MIVAFRVYLSIAMIVIKIILVTMTSASPLKLEWIYLHDRINCHLDSREFFCAVQTILYSRRPVLILSLFSQTRLITRTLYNHIVLTFCLIWWLANDRNRVNWMSKKFATIIYGSDLQYRIIKSVIYS